LAVASAELVGDHLPRTAGYGRTASFADADRVALYEAVERRNGMRPRRRRTTLVASFAELGPDRALDPLRLGRYEPDYERHPDFGLVPYSPDVRTTWVYGWSYTNAKPVAVPEHVAYWAVEGTRFVDETSNGCGLGNSLTEAVLHGLFEVAERDAFLMAWYAKTPLRPLAVPAADPVLPHLVDRLASLGYELLFFDATNDIGIPSVISLARYRGADERTPAAFFAAGAHPDPHRAMISAAAEVAVDIESAAAEPATFHRDRLHALLAEPTLIRTMQDHTAVNSLPETASRHGFLLQGNQPVADPVVTSPQCTDLRAVLDDWVRRLAELDLEVIAVDQTDPVIAERLGLYSAKVIVPGALPMTFGELRRRTLGLPRLLDVPYRLGRVPAPLRYESLALQPHPFP
jgi:ribosomal protein S12 methylthiotransferase accessory factor